MSLKKVTTNITYKVPAWEHCNLVKPGTLNKPSKDLCRFCVKENGTYRCALYNMPLDVAHGTMPIKAHDCKRAVAGFKSIVEDVKEQDKLPEVDPAIIIKATLDTYEKMRKSLLSQGYPAALAETLAKEYLLGGKAT